MRTLSQHEREFINEARDVKNLFPQQFDELMTRPLGYTTLINAINQELVERGIARMTYVNGINLLKEFFGNK